MPWFNDTETGIYADPAKVLDVNHDGKYYRLNGCHLVEPSPQRTPVLFQAGSSPRGMAFAATHAECAFLVGPNPEVVGTYIEKIRAAALALGRDRASILCFAYLKIITGSTASEAQRKYDEYFSQVDYESTMVMMSGWSGVDFGELDPEHAG